MNLIVLFDRVKNRFLRDYRAYIFKCRTGQKATILGKLNLINTNLKCGENVTFYPDVMLFGDGCIEIGDHVSIGNGTVIYASKSGGGGKNWKLFADCGAMLYH